MLRAHPKIAPFGYVCLSAIAASMMLFSLTSAALAQTPRELPPLAGDNGSEALAINDRDEIAGRSSRGAPDNTTSAVVWDRRGMPRALAFPKGLEFEAIGYAINNRGEVAGTAWDGDTNSPPSAFFWDRSGMSHLLPRPDIGEDCFYVHVTGINNRGDVVGWCGGDGRRQATAVQWDREGHPILLPPLPGDLNSMATAINYRGQVSGASFGEPTTVVIRTAVRWTRRGVPQELPPLVEGYDQNIARAINNKGQVVGLNGASGADDDRIVVWDQHRNPSERTTFELGEDCAYPGAAGISNIGEVVGTCTAYYQPTSMGVLFDRSGTAFLLPPLDGDTKSLAWGINSLGHIVGRSEGPSGTTAVVWR